VGPVGVTMAGIWSTEMDMLPLAPVTVVVSRK
jgi:hypothetical protein